MVVKTVLMNIFVKSLVVKNTASSALLQMAIEIIYICVSYVVI